MCFTYWDRYAKHHEVLREWAAAREKMENARRARDAAEEATAYATDDPAAKQRRVEEDRRRRQGEDGGPSLFGQLLTTLAVGDPFARPVDIGGGHSPSDAGSSCVGSSDAGASSSAGCSTDTGSSTGGGFE